MERCAPRAIASLIIIRQVTGDTMKRSWQLSFWAAGACLLSSAMSSAQTFPSKGLRMIIPAPAGGSVDTVARAIGQRLAEALGQPVVADNRPGAGSMLASELTAKAPPDGHTLLMATSSHAINGALYKGLRYDPVKDFAAVSLVAAAPFLLVVHPSVPAASTRELIEVARKRPGQLHYASAGTGSSTHLAGELFRLMANVDVVHVPYKGGGPALTALVGGETHMMFHNLISVQPMINAKRLRALAVTSARRLGVLPDLPTVAESGLPGYESGYWYGVLAPGQTPEPVVAVLNREINRIIASGEVKNRLVADGLDPAPGTPAAFAAVVRNEIDKWARLSSRLTIKLD